MTKGFAPILIVILIAAVLGGYLLYQKQTEPEVNHQQPASTTANPTASPIPTPSAKIASNKKPTPTPTSIPKQTPSPTPNSSPLSSPSPNIKPSPVPGVINMVLTPGTDINMKVNQGYASRVELRDSNDDVLKDQSDFDFSWTAEDPSFGYFIFGEDCYYSLYDIQPPCPKINMTFNSTKTGSTKVKVKVTKKSENKVIGEGTFNINVN